MAKHDRQGLGLLACLRVWPLRMGRSMPRQYTFASTNQPHELAQRPGLQGADCLNLSLQASTLLRGLSAVGKHAGTS